jgi:hypothetical protein
MSKHPRSGSPTFFAMHGPAMVRGSLWAVLGTLLSAAGAPGYELHVRAPQYCEVQAGQAGSLDLYFDIVSGSASLAGYNVKLDLTGPSNDVLFTGFSTAAQAVFPVSAPQANALYALPGRAAAAYDDLPDIGTANPIADGAGLVRVHFQTTAASGGVYAVTIDPNAARTNFADGNGDPLTVSSFVGGQLAVLHAMTWTGQSGNWSDAAWTGSPPGVPDRAADAVINGPATVTVTGVQQAHSVAVNAGGRLAVSGGSLTVMHGIGGTGDTTVDGHLTAGSIVQDTLTIAAGASVTIRETTAGSNPANVVQVPEPSTLGLLLAIAAALLVYTRLH